MKKINYLLLVLFATNIYASDVDDFDILMSNEFGKTKSIVQKIPKKKSYSISYNGLVKTRGYYFFKNTHYKDRNNHKAYLDMVAEIGSKLKKDKWLFSGTIFAMRGTDYTTYDYKKLLKEFRDTNLKVPVGGIKELYVLYSGNNYDILAGKKIFNVGISILYSPSNVYNMVLSPDPLNPYTVGTWITKFSYYKNNSEYTVAFFPFISNSKTFSPKSRWGGRENSSSENYNNFSIPKGSKVDEDKENKVRVLLRTKSNIVLFNRGVDYILDLGYGPSLYTILENTKKPNEFLETRPESWYVSTGFSTTYKKFEFHSEVYYQYVLNSLDDNFISAVIGSSYNLDYWVNKIGLNEVKIILEYTKEFVTQKADNPKTYRSSNNERAPKNDILYKIDGKINDKTFISYSGDFRLEIKNQKDSGKYQKVSFHYKWNDNLDSDVFLEIFDGDKNSYYGRWKDNNRIGVDLKYSF